MFPQPPPPPLTRTIVTQCSLHSSILTVVASDSLVKRSAKMPPTHSELAYLMAMIDPKTRANSSIGFDRWPTAKPSIFSRFTSINGASPSLAVAAIGSEDRRQSSPLMGRLDFSSPKDPSALSDTKDETVSTNPTVQRPKDLLLTNKDWRRESISRLLQQNALFREPPKIIYTTQSTFSEKEQPGRSTRTEMVAFDQVMLQLLDRTHLVALCRHYGLAHSDELSRGHLQQLLLRSFNSENNRIIQRVQFNNHELYNHNSSPLVSDAADNEEERLIDRFYHIYGNARRRAVRAVLGLVGHPVTSEYPIGLWQMVAEGCGGGMTASSARLRWMLKRRDEMDELAKQRRLLLND